MSGLVTDNRFADPDAALRILTEAHRPLTETRARPQCPARPDPRQPCGDATILAEAVALARRTMDEKR